LPGWQAVFEDLKDDNFMIIAAAQDTGGEAAAGQFYDQAKAKFVTLVDEDHSISSLYNLVNVPSAVWIDETGKVIRIDENAYAEVHKGEGFSFGRSDYVPMVKDWVANGNQSQFAKGNAIPDLIRSNEQHLADANFKLGVYFFKQGDMDSADKYWVAAEKLNPDSWNYHRQDWSFTPEQAGANWVKKFGELEGKPYYRPIDGLDI